MCDMQWCGVCACVHFSSQMMVGTKDPLGCKPSAYDSFLEHFPDGILY